MDPDLDFVNLEAALVIPDVPPMISTLMAKMARSARDAMERDAMRVLNDAFGRDGLLDWPWHPVLS